MTKIEGNTGSPEMKLSGTTSKDRSMSKAKKAASDKSSSSKVAEGVLNNSDKLHTPPNTSKKLKVRVGAIDATLPKETLKKMGSTLANFIRDADAEGGGVDSVELNSLSHGLERNHALDKALVDYLVAYSEYIESESPNKNPPEVKMTKENVLYFHRLADYLDFDELKKQVLKFDINFASSTDFNFNKDVNLAKEVIKNVILKNTIRYRLKHISLKSLMNTLQNIFKAHSNTLSFEMIIERCLKCGMIPTVLDDGSLSIEVKGQCSEFGKKNLKALKELIPISKLIIQVVPEQKSIYNLVEILPEIKSLTINHKSLHGPMLTFFMPKVWEKSVVEVDFTGVRLDPMYGHFYNLNAKKIKLDKCLIGFISCPYAEEVKISDSYNYTGSIGAYLPSAEKVSLTPNKNWAGNPLFPTILICQNAETVSINNDFKSRKCIGKVKIIAPKCSEISFSSKNHRFLGGPCRIYTKENCKTQNSPEGVIVENAKRLNKAFFDSLDQTTPENVDYRKIEEMIRHSDT